MPVVKFFGLFCCVELVLGVLMPDCEYSWMTESELDATLVKFGFDFLERGALLGKVIAHVRKDEDLMALINKLSSLPRCGKYLLLLFIA